MEFFKCNLDNIKVGFDGEEVVRKFFTKKNIPFMQVDIMFFYKEKWCLGEIKTQEKFLSPPFDGHGLPKWQIDRRISFYESTGIIPYLIVNCLTDKCLYISNLLDLVNTNHFSTNGKKPRVIFDIKHFKRIEFQ